MTSRKSVSGASMPKSVVVNGKRAIKPLAIGRSASMDHLVNKVHTSDAFSFESACANVHRAVKASNKKA